MKVNLIIPPDPFLGDDKRNPPLGLLYLAAITKDMGYDVGVTDLRGIDEKDLIANLPTGQDVYGLTSSTPSYYNASMLAKAIKAQSPNSLTVLGGIHATSLPRKIGHEFDKVVIGEGEKAFLQILEDFQRKNNPNKKFYKADPIKELDFIPFPARDLVPLDSVFSKNAFSVDGEYAGTLITSRGCPYDCSFCGSQTMWGKKVRFRSPENVVQELKEIIGNYRIKHFRFQDDTMSLIKKRLKFLCEGMGPLEIHWRATTRVNRADLETLKMMKQAGCEEIGYGIESLDQEVLNRNHKGIKLNQVYKAMENTKKVGLQSRLFFIIGLPGEKPGFAKRLEKFLDETNPEGVDVSTMVPYPGSPIFHSPAKFGIKLKPMEFEKYHMTLGMIDGERERPLTFIHDVLSEEQIIEEREDSLKIILERKQVRNF
ncbi:MAG: radical SAM protein [Nanoarchaeota archaeon]|nr:B12-binding domain-containing radical SAM protein [Nanoarchaeota archaeon]